MVRIRRLLGWTLLALALLVLSGWLLADQLTPPAVGAPGHALPTQPAETMIDREVAPLLATHGDQSGAILITDGLDAFAARALSARHAGRSLDLQYYIWKDDLVGHLLAYEAWQAAERGVRVRIMLDDLNAEGLDAKWLALDAHPNVEIRLYNPFRNRDGLMRMLEMVQRVFSVNHRMHNKAWIADNRVAVVGGRNIGDEYFNASTTSNFHDMDMLLMGPAVAQASSIFDRYWNSDAVVPIAALNSPTPDELTQAVTRIRQETLGPDASQYLQRVASSPQVLAYLSRQLAPFWSNRIHVYSDPPLKWKQDNQENWLVTRLTQQIAATRQSAQLISPYFVPGDAGTDGLVGLVRAQHAQVGVVTNSLAANDVPSVYAGYSKYRDRLLDGGVELYELRVHGAGDEKHGLFGSSGASLHSKAFVIDDRYGFVGSFNLDPRSAYLNTEMGVLFDDHALAQALREEYRHLSSPALSYRVLHDESGDPYWLDRSTQPPTRFDHAPDTSWWMRATTTVIGWLPIESQL